MIFLRADLADLSSHQTTVDAAVAEFGRIDCLVNNAGIASIVRGDFLDLKPENFDTIVGVNLRGTVFFTQAVLKAMLASEIQARRSIINITSVSAAMTSPERLDYCMSKAGLAAFSQGLALRLAETGIAGLRSPSGIVRSDMTAAVFRQIRPVIESGLVPIAGRWGEPRISAISVAGLAGGQFGFAPGSVIQADGGLSIGRLCIVCGRSRSPGRRDLPLTLTLSRVRGEGTWPPKTPAVMVANAATASPFSPPAGKRCGRRMRGMRDS